MLMVKVICRGSSLGMNDGSVALKRRQKRQPVEWHHATSSRSYPFSKESPWPLFFFFWGGGGVNVVKALIQVFTFILVKVEEVFQEI